MFWDYSGQNQSYTNSTIRKAKWIDFHAACNAHFCSPLNLTQLIGVLQFCTTEQVSRITIINTTKTIFPTRCSPQFHSPHFFLLLLIHWGLQHQQKSISVFTSVNSQPLVLHTNQFHTSLETASLIQLNVDKICSHWNFYTQQVSAVYGAPCCRTTHLVRKVLEKKKKRIFTLHTLYLFNRGNLRFGYSLSFQSEQSRLLKPLPLLWCFQLQRASYTRDLRWP